ncbi:Ankyrin-2 [Durusdinium trenchii]|uniref:Ankyrin-2 n=1 Tax=Durusdinium trenchii TaxID=1381693 RepID=A0ABP0QTA5_9DINO
MWVLKISDFMTMSGAPVPFEELQEQGLLHEWDPSLFTILVSHEWLGRDHPDVKGYQSHCLRMALFNVIDGSLRVEYDVLAQSLGYQRVLSEREKEQIRSGYLWMDWFCVPQRRSSLHASIVSPSSLTSEDLFCILAPTLHNSRSAICSYQTWQSRGWCRAEVWFRQISSKRHELPMLLISGDEGVKFLRAHFWLYALVHEGGFTMEHDRDGLKPIVSFFLKERRRASLHCRASKNLDLDIIPGLTPLHFAAKHACDPAAIMALLALRADVNETDAIGTSVIGHAGTKEIAKLLIEMGADEIIHLLLGARADVNYREGFYRPLGLLARLLCNLQRRPSALLRGIAGCGGSTPLYIAAWFGNPEAVNLLLQARADPELRNDRGVGYLEVLNHHNCIEASTAMTWQVRSESAWTEVRSKRQTNMVVSRNWHARYVFTLHVVFVSAKPWTSLQDQRSNIEKPY